MVKQNLRDNGMGWNAIGRENSRPTGEGWANAAFQDSANYGKMRRNLDSDATKENHLHPRTAYGENCPSRR